MSRQQAEEFIERVRSERAFRAQAYHVEGAESFQKWIAASGYQFDHDEMHDALRAMLLKAKDEAAAEEINELKQWYVLLSGNMPVSPRNACGACSMKDSCKGIC